MKALALGLIGLLAVALVGHAEPTTQPSNGVPPVLNFTMKTLSGKDVSLSQYQGKVILIVNTASKCGYTPQYKPLEALYKKYQDKGFVILGFPSNDFHQQEPGTDAQITEFCTKNYGVTFDMFSKVDVKGASQCDLYKYLTDAQTYPAMSGDVKWNFEKFLISKDGKVVNRFRSAVRPESDEVVGAIEAELAK